MPFASWNADRNTLRLLQHQQSDERYVWSPGEEPIGDEQFSALAATPVTDAELAQLRAARGEYRPGDTRGFVEQQEITCLQYNCWMVRDGDSALRHLSEPPTAKETSI